VSGDGDHDPSTLTTEALNRDVGSAKAALIHMIEAQKELFGTQLQLSMKMLDERYATQTKALDAAFLAQQAAMTTAFSAAEKAVQAALLAAEKAVDKANTANEKRFESVNEFRGQLNDVVSSMISRAEAEARFNAVDGRLIEMKSSLDKGFSAVDSGHLRGQEMWGYLIGAAGLITVVITTLITLSHH
jgi:hypothetical protein